MSDEPDDLGHEKAIDDAFLNSHSLKLGDLELEPYTPNRRIAAQAIGMFYGSLSDADIAQLERTKLYPGITRDIAVVLWLCTLKDDPKNGATAERLVDEAARDRIGSATKAYAFADEHGLVDTDTLTFWDGYAVYSRILRQVKDSRVEAKKKTSAQSKQDALIPASGLTT